MTELKTLDTDFAAAVMARGARLEGWEKSDDGKKLYWCLTQINEDWIDDYRQGRDGMTKFMQNRRMLVNVAKTEIKSKESRR
jgi:hypothetical protein